VPVADLHLSIADLQVPVVDRYVSEVDLHLRVDLLRDSIAHRDERLRVAHRIHR
jgi:hypothetical protein